MLDKLKIIIRAISVRFNKILFLFYAQKKIDKNLIVLESDGDCCDNAYALFDYMEKNGYLLKYKVVWLVDYPNNYINSENVKYCYKHINRRPSFKTVKALATCRYYIYDHSDFLGNNKREGQRAIFLTHGAGFKASTPEAKCLADEVYTVSPFFYKPVSDWCGCTLDIMKDLGFPRLDYFFNELNEAQIRTKNFYKFSQYKKIFLWMPTFRKSKNKNISENYFSSDTGLPIIIKAEDLMDFNDVLNKNQSLCIFKVHHLQAELQAFSENYSNIIMINDELISKHGLQLYEFIRLTDALITDYSSISTDYMLLEHPIIYTMDDYDEYKNSRGFSIDDPKQYFIGHHAYDKSQLYEAMQEISDGFDRYRDKRNAMLPIMHSNIDGNASLRILEHLGIKL